MEFISTIDNQRYAVLEKLYSLQAPVTFSHNTKLTGKMRDNLCGKFKQLERLIHTTNQQWWDKFFLQQYTSTQISPRGLRIMKECPIFLDDDNTKEWSNLSKFCTAKWMEILISHRNNTFDKLNEQTKNSNK